MTQTTFFGKAEDPGWLDSQITEMKLDDSLRHRIEGLLVLRIGAGGDSLSWHTDRLALEQLHTIIGEWLIENPGEATEREEAAS